MYFPMPDELDHNRLHETIERLIRGELSSRGEGLTTARLYMMFGEIEAGDPDVSCLFVAENELSTKWASHAFRQLVYEVYPDMETPYAPTYPHAIVLPNGQRFWFYSVDTIVANPNVLRGVRKFDKVFFDVSDDKLACNNYFGHQLDEIMLILFGQGAEII